MEQDIPMVAKKIWHIVRVAYFMLRKGMSKKKLLFNLNIMKHRSKLTGKALIRHLIFHHHHDTTTAAATSTADSLPNPADGGEYEFSCSSTPLYRHYFPKRKNRRGGHVPNTCMEYEGGQVNFEEVSKALEIMVSNDDVSGAYSPALPGLGFGFGFGPSPMPVRQLRITDSPYPIQNPDPEDHRVDHEAEEFINRFYSQLIKQHV